MWKYQSTDTERPCLDCKEMLPISAFPSRQQDSTTRYHARRCLHCQRAHKRKYLRRQWDRKNAHRRDTRNPNPDTWIYRSTDTARPCKQCRQLLPMRKFPLRKSSSHGQVAYYHCRTCADCLSPKEKKRPHYATDRRNSRGEWYCPRCKQFLHVSKFRMTPKGKPFGYCRECYNTYQRGRWVKNASRDDWYKKELERSNRKARERRRKAHRERDQLARDAYRWLSDHGWTTKQLMKECHLSHGTIVKLRTDTPILWPSVMEKLVALWKREMGLQEIAA